MGAKEERVEESSGKGHAWEFLFNFSKVTENEELCRSMKMLSAEAKDLRRIKPARSDLYVSSDHTKAEFNNCLVP